MQLVIRLLTCHLHRVNIIYFMLYCFVSLLFDEFPALGLCGLYCRIIDVLLICVVDAETVGALVDRQCFIYLKVLEFSLLHLVASLAFVNQLAR